ncbi:hypothetical protein I4F81_002488 [Pyropia yezoensis]|uniref:Uncharacterized protein n=1 Tax=Pyropia yezoensis TaxID=2788 RepID=A0ACC3BR78_PYRYE|nr:hypothetical protein I4F81_002488 [Neopyropia yezoensis]
MSPPTAPRRGARTKAHMPATGVAALRRRPRTHTNPMLPPSHAPPPLSARRGGHPPEGALVWLWGGGGGGGGDDKGRGGGGWGGVRAGEYARRPAAPLPMDLRVHRGSPVGWGEGAAVGLVVRWRGGSGGGARLGPAARGGARHESSGAGGAAAWHGWGSSGRGGDARACTTAARRRRTIAPRDHPRLGSVRRARSSCRLATARAPSCSEVRDGGAHEEPPRLRLPAALPQSGVPHSSPPPPARPPSVPPASTALPGPRRRKHPGIIPGDDPPVPVRPPRLLPLARVVAPHGRATRGALSRGTAHPSHLRRPAPPPPPPPTPCAPFSPGLLGAPNGPAHARAPSRAHRHATGSVCGGGGGAPGPSGGGGQWGGLCLRPVRAVGRF